MTSSHELDLRVRLRSHETIARCPSHDDRDPSLAVYDKDGKAKVVCFAGCNDALDILPALEMTVADLYDEDAQRQTHGAPDPAWQARAEARKSMDPIAEGRRQPAPHHRLGERLCKTIARHPARAVPLGDGRFGLGSSDARGSNGGTACKRCTGSFWRGWNHV